MEEETKFAIYNHWTLFYSKDNILAYTSVGKKSLLVFYNETNIGIKCSIQVHDGNRVYYAHIEDGKLIERSFENEKQEDRLSTEDLKVYSNIIYTLPEKLKDIVTSLF